MTDFHAVKLSGIAHPANVTAMLDEICEHFLEHSDVVYKDGIATLKSTDWTIEIATTDDFLNIEIRSENDEALAATRTMFAEHLFYFAGEQPFSLEWSTPAPKVRPPGFFEATVVSAEDVTPRMRRVTLSLADVSPFIGGSMHVRLLVPPRGRTPVWPNLEANGRIGWPEGEDELIVRVYTIRSVDLESNRVCIDFLQHPAEGVATPGADFARDTMAGEQVALMGPGGGGLPQADVIFFAGDESALPAIARMVEEAPPGVTMTALIEVENAGEEQALRTQGRLYTEWLHRASYAADGAKTLVGRVKAALENVGDDTFVWFAAEKSDVRAIKRSLADRKRDRKRQYVAWYWDKES
ncbi:DUF2218 domain-containing protein [Rhizobium sp. CECT 9324]|uniref:DUF2218 domain-containing protein n=1 Tax=Rhizobium sp. CECT 9324 TaxID=2845820 RepID=UPI001E5B1571|nr:DUF2218 domain-containing protein [Rhizobium sp. CECT 9324]CAH0342673.1 hypothetical protein RHI9324_04402 [Rhizobium sp. CECT 9324]